MNGYEVCKCFLLKHRSRFGGFSDMYEALPVWILYGLELKKKTFVLLVKLNDEHVAIVNLTKKSKDCQNIIKKEKGNLVMHR